MNPHAHGLVEIGRLVLRFAKINRATFHEDGARSESDTDHTVMLSVCACALAERLYPELDLGKIAQFAIVHDLVEAYVGDTDSFGISHVDREEKERKEAEALHTLRSEFDQNYPWIGATVSSYEALDTKEARFVKTVDKAMSKITHILNKGTYFKNRGLDEETMWNNYTMLMKTAEGKYGAEFPEVLSIMESLMEEARKQSYA